MQKGWTESEEQTLRRLWQKHAGRFAPIAREMGRTRGSIDGKSRVMGLHFPANGTGRVLDPEHPAVRQAKTAFPSKVQIAGELVLKPGDNQRKLGRVVQKGPWRGMPLFSLSLEERATCPRSCIHWRSCMGNNMPHAVRFQYGQTLYEPLWANLDMLNGRYPDGFVVRLHILGDFFSVRYLEFWALALECFPALHVFGYTHRHEKDPIGVAVHALRDARWDRFAIRTSSGPFTSPAALTVDRKEDLPSGAILCPAQTGKTLSCGSCALCWSPNARHRPIAFLRH